MPEWDNTNSADQKQISLGLLRLPIIYHKQRVLLGDQSISSTLQTESQFEEGTVILPLYSGVLNRRKSKAACLKSARCSEPDVGPAPFAPSPLYMPRCPPPTAEGRLDPITELTCSVNTLLAFKTSETFHTWKPNYYFL